MKINDYGKKKENQIGTDFQGWPIYKMNWRQIFEALGIKKDGNSYVIKEDSELLDKFPICLEDDGMGYGVNAKFISSVNSEGYLFIDTEQPDEVLDNNDTK